MEGLKKVGTIVVSVILWIIILVAALFAFTTLATRDVNKVANIAGYTPLNVASQSMSPTFEQGDMIIIQQVDPSTLKEGDIITFHAIIENQYALNTHRIESITETNGVRNYVTKGDNNALADTHTIADGDIVGKEVMVIKGMGNVMDFLSSSLGFLLVIVLPMLLFFIYQVYHLITISINLKRATAEEARLAEAERLVELEEAKKAAGKHATVAEADVDEAARMKAEAEAALAEAKRLKEEAEAIARSAGKHGRE